MQRQMPPDKLLSEYVDPLKPTKEAEVLDDEEKAADEQIDPLWKQANDAQVAKKEHRIELVRRMMVRGFHTHEEIRQGLAQISPEDSHLSNRSLERYKKIIHARNRAEIAKRGGSTHTLEELLVQLSDTYTAVTEEMWKMYYSKDTPKATKATLLKNIQEVEDKFTERLQKLGIIEEAAQKIQMLDKDGLPTDPNTTNVVQINADFNDFIRQRFQDPIPIEGNET